MSEPVPAPAAPPASQVAENTCPLCAGSGEVDNNGQQVPCPECEGSGRVLETVGDA